MSAALKNLGDVAVLGEGALGEDGVVGSGVAEALVDDPGVRGDFRAPEVLGELGGLVDGCGLGEGDEQYARELGVA